MLESNATLIVITVILALGMIFQSVDVIDLWFQSKSQTIKTILPKGTSYLIATTLRIFIIFKEFTVVYFTIIGLLEILLFSALVLQSYKKSVQKINWIFNKVRDNLRVQGIAPHVLWVGVLGLMRDVRRLGFHELKY